MGAAARTNVPRIDRNDNLAMRARRVRLDATISYRVALESYPSLTEIL